jgi:hypothetical protein
MRRILGITTSALVGACLAATPVLAQQQRELPFSSTYRRPTVSPYMQLQQQGFNPLQQQNIYQTMVQPQVQQQQQQIEQLTQRKQMQKLQNQVQQIGRDTSGRQVDESIRATGHRATYMNYSHYYQPAR